MADTPNTPNLPQDPQALPPQPPPKRKRRWLRITVISATVLLLFFVGLVLLLPTIVSTAPMRRFVVGKINENLNGTVDIQEWSLGWSGGIDVRGVKVFDDRKAEVLSVAHLHTDLSLVDAARGKFHFGNTTVDEPNIEQFIIYPDGSNNLQKLAKQSTQTKSESSASTGTKKEKAEPDISGVFTITRLRGFIQDQRAGQPIIIAPESNLTVKIKSATDPIENAMMLVYRVGSDGAPGTIKLGGTVTAGAQPAIDEKLELIALPLAGANPFLAMAGQKLTLGGTADGSIVFKTAGSSQSVEGQITATKLTAGGEALNGETYSTNHFKLPVKLTTTTLDAQTMRLKIESLGIETDQAMLSVTGDAAAESLKHIAANQAPGDDGKLAVSLRVPGVKALAAQLPKTLHLQDGVTITGGDFAHDTSVTISKDKTVLASATNFDVAGTRDGKPIALSPISQKMEVTILPGAAKLPDLHNLTITLASGFASIHGGGKTLANLDLGGNVDLPKMRKELGQFVDFGKLELAGTAEFSVRTSGDLTKTGSPVKLDATVNATDLKVSGLAGTQPIEQPLILFAANGNVLRDAEDAFKSVEQLAVTLHVGSQDAPVIDASIQKGQLMLPAKQGGAATPVNVWDLIRGGEIAATVNLPRAKELADRFSVPTTKPVEAVLAAANAKTPAAPTTQPLAPVKIVDGVATVKLAIARDPASQKTTIQDGEIAVDKLVLTRGDSRYAPAQKAVVLQFAGTLDAGKQVQGVSLTKLDGNLLGNTVKMTKPVEITGLATTPAAAGELEIAGKFADLSGLLETLDGKAHSYPYQGDYHITQTVATKGDAISISGIGAVLNFQVNDEKDGHAVFKEQALALANNLSYDSKLKNLSISNLKLDMNGSDALHVALVGSVLDIGGKQSFDGVKLTLGYDLQKLWPLITPFLSPADQKDAKTAVVTGMFEREFTLGGSYPAGKPFSEAVATVIMDGSLSIGRFNALGIDLANFEQPVSLKNGIAKLTETGKSAYLNGGTLTLGGPWIDLTKPVLRITTPKDWKLVSNITVNPLLGNSLGKFFNPVFTNAQRAQGLLDVTVNYCDGMGLGDAMKSLDSGSAKVTVSLRDMDIANPFGSELIGHVAGSISIPGLGDLLSGLGGGKGVKVGNTRLGGVAASGADTMFKGEIKDAVITLDHGITTQDLTMQLVDPSQTQPRPGAPVLAGNVVKPLLLTFKGTVRLNDLSEKIALKVPPLMLEKFIPVKNFWPAVAQACPDGLPVLLNGTTSKPEFDLEAALPELTKAGVNAGVNLLTGGKGGGKNPPPNNPNGANNDNTSGDPLGDLLKGIQGGKKKKGN